MRTGRKQKQLRNLDWATAQEYAAALSKHHAQTIGEPAQLNMLTDEPVQLALGVDPIRDLEREANW